MGISTNGILVFGIPCEEEFQKPHFMGEFDDFEDYLDNISDLPQYGEKGYSFDANCKLREKCPADLITHCAADYPMYILALRGTVHTASRGYIETVDPSIFNISPERIDEFKVWAKERGIEGEPKWILCSMWS